MRADPATYRAVNLLFLIVLLLQVSNVLLLWMPQYVRLILNQALFVLLPAYLYLRLTRQPIRERVRWRWPGWKVAALALLIGAALYPLSATSAGVLQQLLGYVDFALPDDAIPSTALMGVLGIVAYAVMAPIREEFLFRGVIQPVYQRRGPRWGIPWVGFLFTIFHLSLLQGLSIVLLALALGFVNYRTRSLPASILTHVGANSLAALVLTSDIFVPGITAMVSSPTVLVASPAVALIAFVAFVRLTRQVDQPPQTVEPDPGGHPLALAASWPLLIAGVFYLLVIGAEFRAARSPELSEPLRVSAADWDEARGWQCEVRNIVDDVVGDGECQLVQDGPLVELTCTSTVSG